MADLKGKKRYNLVLPESMYSELKQAADERETSPTDMLRRFVEIGLLAVELQETPGADLIERRSDGADKSVIRALPRRTPRKP